jgi:hypothetical protein
MLYYTFFKNYPEKSGFKSVEDGLQSLLQYDFLLDEITQIISYNLNHINFVSNTNNYSFTCPLDIHCQYNIRQILAAFDYFNESQAPEFREGVKYFEDKKTDIYLINLNKSEKEFSPSTMYEDYAINETLFHWQSQSQASETSSTIQRYINHKKLSSNISLFVREFKKNGNYVAPYTFLGNANYIDHYGNKPVSFTWKLHTPIPASLLQKANKSVVI